MHSTLKRKSLRVKMLAVVGSVIVGLTLAISLGILIQWRALILEQLQNKAESVTRAFAISALDALIYGENENFQVEDLLESYIGDLKAKVPGIRFIMVLDNQRRVIVHSDPQMYNRVLNDSLSKRLMNAKTLMSGIYQSPKFGWIIESVLPLQIGGKRWGVLRIAYDAQQTRKEIGRLFFILVGLTVLVTIGVLLVLEYLIGRTIQSLKILVEAMDSTELESEFAPSLPQRNDEIGFLIGHFEMLRKRLAASREQLIEAQKQIYHAEKLASVGRLASGVAHEINNPLNGIKHCVYAIQKEPENQDQLKKYLSLINEGLENIESVVQKLLGFARKSTQSSQPVDLTATIRQVIALLEYRITQKQIHLQLVLAPDLPPIIGDGSLLQEVIMNLLMNSYDAIVDNGTILVKTQWLPEAGVSLIIKDNGMGMASEEIDKIFDPFYTTKQPGEGTGLGLSVALGIVQAYGGRIEVESVIGRGSKFSVILPIGENT